MYSVCLCARYQSSTKNNHLKAVKHTFRYLNGIGLWYPKDISFNLKGILMSILQDIAQKGEESPYYFLPFPWCNILTYVCIAYVFIICIYSWPSPCKTFPILHFSKKTREIAQSDLPHWTARSKQNVIQRPEVPYRAVRSLYYCVKTPCSSHFLSSCAILGINISLLSAISHFYFHFLLSW